MILEEHIFGEIQKYHFPKEEGETGFWETYFELSDSNVLDASTKRQCCADGAFEIGTAYCATLRLVCRLPGASTFAIRGAKIILRAQYGTEENPEPIGTFWVTDAQKTDDIFTLSGQCAMGWADTSSYNSLDEISPQTMAHLIAPDGAAAELQTLMSTYSVQPINGVTSFANAFSHVLAGIPDLITWENYNTAINGSYCNQWIYDENTKTETAYKARFSVWDGNGTSATDCPRDYYRWMSQLAGGFVTTTRHNTLTLRQYGMPEFGTAELHMSDLEQDGCEVADYCLQIYKVSVVPELKGENWVSGYSTWTTPLYSSRVPIRLTVERNPVLDGFCKRWIIDEKSVPSVWTIAHNLWWAFHYHYGEIPIRPFRAVTHKQQRFELGQPINIYYRDTHETQETCRDSVITSITWRFRGGHTLACGGEDSRVMADCVRATKSDKVLRELHGRFDTIR